MAIERIVSGAQTGADRAALDVALACGLPSGGWVPRGRLDENGVIPAHYPNLVEADSADPSRRTALNVRDSDATLIFSHGALTGGSAFTRDIAVQTGKPWMHVDLSQTVAAEAAAEIQAWLSEVRPRVLNVAGPRASHDPEIYDATRLVLAEVLKASAETR